MSERERKPIRIDVEEYVSDRFVLRSRSQGKNGTEFICDCPVCDGQSKLYVNQTYGSWVCFKCADGGGFPKLMSITDDITIEKAINIVRESERRAVGVDDLIKRAKRAREERTHNDVGEVVLPPEFVPCYANGVWRLPDYLAERGTPSWLAAMYRLGFCLIGKYANRLIFPVYMGGVLKTWQGRAMDGRNPKYLAPPIDTSEVVFGFDQLRGAKHVAVVEGAFDVLGCAKARVPAVCLLGKRAHAGQVLALKRAGVESVTMFLDPEASVDAELAVETFGNLLDVKVAALPPEYDPGNAPADAIHDAVAGARAPSVARRMGARRGR